MNQIEHPSQFTVAHDPVTLDRNRSMRGKRNFALTTVTLAAVAGAIWYLKPFPLKLPFGGSQPTITALTTEKVRGVRVITIKNQVQIEKRSFSGVVVPRWESNLAFRAGGKIIARAIEVGQKVAVGQELMRLDPEDYNRAINAAAADFEAAKSSFAQAKSELERQTKLFQKGWVAKAAIEKLTAANAVAREKVVAAEESLALSANRQSYTTLRAEESGTVTIIKSEVGEVVAEGQPVITVVRDAEFEVQVDLPEAAIALTKDYFATATISSLGEKAFPLKLRLLQPTADAASRTYEARFTLPPDADKAVLGMTVIVNFEKTSNFALAAVPSAAVAYKNNEAGVWQIVQDSDRAVFVKVDIVKLGTDQTLLRGLVDDAQVITLGVNRMSENLPIRVIESLAGGNGS
jgi:membrane fusion protein, multidrug efflux system